LFIAVVRLAKKDSANTNDKRQRKLSAQPPVTALCLPNHNSNPSIIKFTSSRITVHTLHQKRHGVTVGADEVRAPCGRANGLFVGKAVGGASSSWEVEGVVVGTIEGTGVTMGETVGEVLMLGAFEGEADGHSPSPEHKRAWALT